MFDQDRAFVNTEVNVMVFILSETILNILSNFVPQETFTVEDKHPIVYKKTFLPKRKAMFTKAI